MQTLEYLSTYFGGLVNDFDSSCALLHESLDRPDDRGLISLLVAHIPFQLHRIDRSRGAGPYRSTGNTN